LTIKNLKLLSKIFLPLKEALVFPTKASKKGDIVTKTASEDYAFTTLRMINFVTIDTLK